jgi:serine/threonine protein phosphatase PrpC
MDILRRIFGLQPVAKTISQSDLEGPTAPLPPQPVVSQAGEATALDDLGKTDILGDGRTQKLPDLDETLSIRPTNGNRLVYGQYSDVGQVRTNNQDAIFSLVSASTTSEEMPNFGIFVVADGMGGHHDGEKASALTTRVIIGHVSNQIFLPMLLNEELNAERPTISEVLREAFQKANQAVSALVPEGGTTATVAAIMGDLAYIAHVGDSRAYIIEKDTIEHVTRDHSLVQRLIELEQLTPEEAAEHPQRNVLYRAIGQNETIDVDAITRRLSPGAKLLICSDGLWNLVPDEEIRTTVQSTPNPQIACETLVKLANERGGNDNISVILIKIPD